MRTHVINGPVPKFDAGAVASAAATQGATALASGGTSLVVDALISVVGKLFGGKGKAGKDPRSAEFIQFVQSVGGGAFQDWVIANKPDAQTWTKRELLPLFYVWLYDTGKSVLWWTNDMNPTAPAAYVPGFTEDAYKAMGIDYWASVAKRQQGVETRTAGKWDGWVMLPGGGTVGAPAPAVNRLKDAVNAAAGSISDAALNNLKDQLRPLEDQAGPNAAKDSTGLLVLGGLALVALASR